jgi:hypothetical protein
LSSVAAAVRRSEAREEENAPRRGATHAGRERGAWRNAPPTRRGAKARGAPSDAARAPREPRAAALAARDIDASARADTARSIASPGACPYRRAAL